MHGLCILVSNSLSIWPAIEPGRHVLVPQSDGHVEWMDLNKGLLAYLCRNDGTRITGLSDMDSSRGVRSGGILGMLAAAQTCAQVTFADK